MAALEYAGYQLDADLLMFDLGHRFVAGPHHLGPVPAGAWTFPNDQAITLPASGDYILVVNFLFDALHGGWVNWNVRESFSQGPIYGANLQDPNTGRPPTSYADTFRFHLFQGATFSVDAGGGGTGSTPNYMLAGSYWRLTLACADIAPFPPDVWCEPFIPQNAADADTLYTAHLERMNDLSVLF